MTDGQFDLVNFNNISPIDDRRGQATRPNITGTLYSIPSRIEVQLFIPSSSLSYTHCEQSTRFPERQERSNGYLVVAAFFHDPPCCRYGARLISDPLVVASSSFGA